MSQRQGLLTLESYTPLMAEVYGWERLTQRPVMLESGALYHLYRRTGEDAWDFVAAVPLHRSRSRGPAPVRSSS